MSGFPGGISVGIARRTGRTTAQSLKRFAREDRMVGNCMLSVLNLKQTGKRSKSRKD